MIIPRKQLKIKVSVLDARTQYGRIDLLVKPADGEGEDWISSELFVEG